jgi:biopolymer transport protein ExbD
MSIHVSSAGDDNSMVDVNTTPLIDVMLCLLIILILSIPAMTHAVKMNMPAGPAPADPPAVVEVEVDFDGSVLWNGELVDEPRLLSQLSTTAVQGSQLQVRTNRHARYEYVARVLAAAQRQGVQKLGFVGDEQYL